MGATAMNVMMLHPARQMIQELDTGVCHFVSYDEFRLEQGGVIDPLELVFETYGRLNPAKDNAVVVHHALSTLSLIHI